MSESRSVPLPPLQRFTHFFHHLRSHGKSEFTAEMEKYFQNDCANPSEITKMQEYCHQNKVSCPLSSEHVEAAKKRACDIEAKEKQQINAATQKAAELLRKVTDALAINQRTHLIGILDDDTAASDFTTVVWTLDSGSFLGPLRLRTLTSAATAAGAYLAYLRAAAQLGDTTKLDTYVDTSIQAMKTAYKDTGHLHVVFGALEIRRHAAITVVGLGTFGEIADSEKTRVENLLHDGAQCIDAMNSEIRNLIDMHQSTNDMTTLRDTCCALLVEYSVFFNTVFAYVDFLRGKFGSFAASFLPYQSALYGVCRFPLMGQIILDSDDKPAAVQTARNPFSNSLYTVSTLKPVSDSAWMFPTATHTYEESLELTVANVVAPPQTFAVILILSALATKSVSDALCLATCVAEVQSLYFMSPDIALLVQEVYEGQWAKVLTSMEALLKKYVEGNPFISTALLTELRAQVKVVVCYHVFTVYDQVGLAEVAKATGLPLMEVEKIALHLIRTGTLSARINRVEGKLTRVIPTDAYSADALLRKTLCETEAAIAHAETQLQLLSAQRHLITASVYSVDPQYWGRPRPRSPDAQATNYTY